MRVRRKGEFIMQFFDKKEDIFELLEKFEKSSVAEIEIKSSEGAKIKMSKVSSAPVYLPEAQNFTSVSVENNNVLEPAAVESGKVIKAPIIGTFYSSGSPEAAPYVKIGDKVSKGAIICILEAMKVMNEIECEEDCEILEILVNNGDQIEYGQPLFKIK